MITKKIKYLSLIGVLASMSVLAEPVLFEDFSKPISLSKYWGMEESIQLNTANQNVNLSAKGKAFSRTGRSNTLSLIDTTSSLLQADVALTELTLGDSASQNALLSISGTYYNTQSASPSDQIGDVFVRLALGDRGNGPEAWYELQESTHPSFDDSTVVTGSFGVISLNTSYPVSIAYDGDNSFTLIFNNGTAVNIDGPARMGVPNAPFRAISQRLRFGRDNSMPDAWEVITESGTTASIDGSVDNVTTDAGLVDDFTASNLDQLIWNQEQTTVALADNQLEMRVIGQGNQETERYWIRQEGLNTFGAKTTLLSSSTQDDATRVRGRLVHFLSNDTYDVNNGDTPNGWEGMIWTQFLLERASGNLRAVVYAERAKDADWTTFDELFWNDLGPINFDQEYELLIEKTGTLVEYKMDGVLVHSFDLATDHNTILSGDDFVPVHIDGVESGLQTRIQDGPGNAHVRFDDIVTDYMPQTLNLNAFNADDDKIAYPDEVIVHEGEEVDISADVSNPADIQTYLWEQESGSEVIATRSRLAGKIVGTDQNFSFKVPDNANKETLAFKVTLIDKAGTETSQQFSLKVDNSKTSTLTGDEGKKKSSGSGAFNPFELMIFISMLAGLIKCRSS